MLNGILFVSSVRMLELLRETGGFSFSVKLNVEGHLEPIPNTSFCMGYVFLCLFSFCLYSVSKQPNSKRFYNCFWSQMIYSFIPFPFCI